MKKTGFFLLAAFLIVACNDSSDTTTTSDSTTIKTDNTIVRDIDPGRTDSLKVPVTDTFPKK